MAKRDYHIRLRRKNDQGLSSGTLMGVCTCVLTAGMVLFFYVWWPVQAHRALNELKSLEKDLSIQKSELKRLNLAYSEMVSLASIDSWAKVNGRWMNPEPDDVITITQ